MTALDAATIGCAVAALLAAPALAAEPGEWMRNEATAKSGFNSVLFAQPAILSDLRSGGQMNGIYFSIGCIDGVTNVALQLGGRLPHDPVVVSVAVDDREPWQEPWSAGDPFDVFIGLWTEDDAVRFLKRVVPSERLTIQFKGKYGVSTYSYDMKMATPLVGEVSERCGWTLQ